MGLDIYWIGLLVLAPAVAFSAGGHNAVIAPLRKLRARRRRRRGRAGNEDDKTDPATSACGEDEEDSGDCSAETRRRRFRWTFFQVYLLVMGSEWLQGPYMYTLLRDEKGLSETTVALLYTAAYGSAAATAFLAGWAADRFGRRAACLAFCAIHCVASASVLSDDVRVLAAGRLAAGVGITLLWTAFESWMVAEWNARGLEEDGAVRGTGVGIAAMFGLMTTYNCITAISAGVLAHCVVLALGSKTDPFLIGMALDVCAAILMLRTWNENRGTGGRRRDRAEPTTAETQRLDLEEAPAPPPATERPDKARSSLCDVRVWTLSFVSCCFEGTIFLLMYFWPGALQEAHAREHENESDGTAAAAESEAYSVPYGIAFACFMGTMVLGALLFNALVRRQHCLRSCRYQAVTDVSDDSAGKEDDDFSSSTSDPASPSDAANNNSSNELPNKSLLATLTTALTPTRFLALALLLAGASFLTAALVRSEICLFVAFLVLEFCNGVYVPSMALHRSAVVGDEGRASVYAVMNVPLFVFVVVALCTSTTGDRGAEHRQVVFLLCAALLLVAAIAAVLGLRHSGKANDGIIQIE